MPKSEAPSKTRTPQSRKSSCGDSLAGLAGHTIAAVILYTCPARTHGANAPLVKHPCGVAAQALDAAGHPFNVKVVGGFKNLPFSRMGKRKEIIELTGQQDVPVLLLDDRSTVIGSEQIVAWAESHPASST